MSSSYELVIEVDALVALKNHQHSLCNKLAGYICYSRVVFNPWRLKIWLRHNLILSFINMLGIIKAAVPFYFPFPFPILHLIVAFILSCA
jgi:hypothetical protein